MNGEFEAIGALFRKGVNLAEPEGFNFVDARSGLQGTKIPATMEQFQTASHLFVASVDNAEAIGYAQAALAAAKQAGALCLLVVPENQSQPLIIDCARQAELIGPEADCVIYVPDHDATSALLAVMTRICAGIADQYALAVDYNDLRTVLSSGRTGVWVSAHGQSPECAHATLLEQTNKTLNRITGGTPNAIKGDLLCICLNNRDHLPAINMIGPHQKTMAGCNVELLYNPGYWPTFPMQDDNDFFVSRIVNW